MLLPARANWFGATKARSQLSRDGPKYVFWLNMPQPRDAYDCSMYIDLWYSPQIPTIFVKHVSW